MATHYEFKEELGRGAMGVVHRAYDPNLKRDVAIKVLKERPGPTSLARFLQEGQVAARVRHPNVLSVHDLVVPERGSPYLVTDYAPGGSLRDLIKRRGLLDPHELRELLRGILSGVAALHAVGVVHRDLKPENILFDAAGTPLIADLGLARALDRETRYTQSGVLTGTPSYMAPEQLDGRSLGPATDVYAVGVILYELLTGRLPFRANTLIEQIRMLLEVKPPSPSSFIATVDPGLAAICLRCLEKDPGARFADAAALEEALRGWTPGGPRSTRAPLLLAILVIALGTVAGATAALLPGSSPAPPSPSALDSTPVSRSASAAPTPEAFAWVLDRESFDTGRVPVLVNRAWALGLQPEGLRLRSNREAGPELYLPFELIGGKLRVRAKLRINYLTKGTALYLRIVPGGPSAQREQTFSPAQGDHDRLPFFEAAISAQRVKWSRSKKRSQGRLSRIEVPPAGPYEVTLELEFGEGGASLGVNGGPAQRLPFQLEGERFCLELTPTRIGRDIPLPRTRRTTLLLPGYGDVLLRELALTAEGERLRGRKPERDWEVLGKAGRECLRGTSAAAILEDLSSLRLSASGTLRNEANFFRGVLASREGDTEGAKIAFQSLLAVNALREESAGRGRLRLMQDFVAGLDPAARLAMAKAYGSEYRVNPAPAHLLKSARLFHAIDEQGLARQAGHVTSPAEALLLFLLAQDAGVEVGPTLLGTAWLFHGEPELALELLDGPAESGDAVALFWGGAAAYFTRDLAKARRYWAKLSTEHPLYGVRNSDPWKGRWLEVEDYAGRR